MAQAIWKSRDKLFCFNLILNYNWHKNINNTELVGNQYEAMTCQPYNESERILMLGERGGLEVNPRGIIRWGVYNLSTHQLKFSNSGMQGIPLNAPGNWTDKKEKRDITNLHIDL